MFQLLHLHLRLLAAVWLLVLLLSDSPLCDCGAFLLSPKITTRRRSPAKCANTRRQQPLSGRRRSHRRYQATPSDTAESMIAPEITPSQTRQVEKVLSSIYGASDAQEYEARRSQARRLTQQITTPTSPLEESPASKAHEQSSTTDLSSSLSDIPDHELVYGELGVAPLVQILNAVGVDLVEEHFLDIGSGHGMLVLAAALLFPQWQSSRGLEIVPHLHEQAVEYMRQLEEAMAMANTSSTQQQSGPSAAAPMELLLGNIYEPTDELSAMLRQTTLAVCFATTWSSNEEGRRLPKLSHALRKGVLAPQARIVVIDGHLLPQDGHVYQGELRIQCPDTVPYSTAYLYTYAGDTS